MRAYLARSTALVVLTLAGVTAYVYDAENRLASVTRGGKMWTQKYDGLGNRTATAENGVWKPRRRHRAKAAPSPSVRAHTPQSKWRSWPIVQ